MPPNLEDRVRALEGFRYAMLGQVNAHRTLLLSAWSTILKNHSDDPVATAEDMRRMWLKAADAPPQAFPGVDPAHLDAVSQEYRVVIEELAEKLVRIARGLARDRNAKDSK